MDELEALIGVLGRWWEDPTLTALGRLPATTTAVPDPDDPFVLDLHGAWAFRRVPEPTAAPAGWTVDAVDEWATAEVPGCWTSQGFGDHPHYTNVVMPFGGDPPSVPRANPTGLYRTTFRRRRGWARRRTILHIGGAETAAAVWCNGRFIGLCTDSRLPSEFDLTAAVVDGDNALAVMVVRWAASTWVEDQDHWHQAGLHRRVFLRSVATTSLADVRVTARLEPDGPGGWASGRLDIVARVDGPCHGWRIDTRLETMTGRAVGRSGAAAAVSQFDASGHRQAMVDAYRHPGPVAATTVALAGVHAWSHEDPHRYRAVVELVDPDGDVREQRRIVTGFKRVEVSGAELLLNGEPLLIAGVNRHDHNPRTGKTSTDEELRADVLNIKRCGFNAIRTSHYPPDPVVLDTCDEIGLWVVCEANLESHARLAEVVHDPRFERHYLERVQRTVATHWNHPSIIGWSLGNESGYGAIHDAAAAWVRATDRSRFVQYEGAVMRRWRGTGLVHDWHAPATDVECPMYAPVERLREWATRTAIDKPLVLCEYSHAMGNSNGGLADYWEAFEQHHGLQGGFIWDWRDQAFLVSDVDGVEYFGYGGVFGDEPNDSSFSCDGMVGPDGTPHPAVEEHRWLTRPVRCERAGARLRVTNRRSYTNIDDLVGRLSVEVDGRTVASRRIDVTGLAPGASTELELELPDRLVGSEAFVTVRWTQRRQTAWARRGHVVAWDQFPVDVDAPPTSPPSRPKLDVAFDVVIDGDSVQLLRDGRPVFDAAPALALWRAPVDNDGVLVGPTARLVGATRRWLAWGLDELSLDDFELRTRGGTNVLRSRWSTGAGHTIEHVERITASNDGSVLFAEDVTIPPELDDLPRVGVRFTLPAGVDRLRWFGRGPWETATDRAHAPVGLWSGTVAEQFVPYVTPQHHGSHVEARWFELVDVDRRGVRVEIDRLTFDVSHHTPEALTAAATIAELFPTPEVHVHIDAALRGVGTGACGPDTTVIVGPGRYRFEWRLLTLA